MAPDEGVTRPVPVERLVPEFKALPTLRQEASDEDIDKWHEGFFDAARESEARLQPAQEEETPSTEAKPMKPGKKKPAAKKPAGKQPTNEPPEDDSDERWSAAYETAEGEIDVSAAFKPRGAGNQASA
jgi:hypothetical protein